MDLRSPSFEAVLQETDENDQHFRTEEENTTESKADM